MIKQLEIHNFKSHERTILELSEGVNVIVGPTDSGKSAIIQALRWLIQNRPTGDSFRSSWGGVTEVRTELENGIRIFRNKSDNYNGYKLDFGPDYTKEDEQIFKAIRTEIPEEIAQALNLNEVNLQTQFESHFLLSKSPGEVASHFNKVAHLDKIDIGIKTVQGWLSMEKRSLEMGEAELTSLKEELKGYEVLTEIEQKVEDLEDIDSQQKELSNLVNEGERLLDDLFDMDTEISRVEKILKVKPLLDQILTIDSKLNQAEEDYDSLIVSYNGIKQIEQWESDLEEVVVAEKLVNELIDINHSIQDLTKKQKELDQCIEAVEVLAQEELKLQKVIDNQENKFHKYIGQGKVCPLCNSIIK